MTDENLDITQMAEYGQAMRDFQIAKGQGEANGDQLAVLKAEADLNKTLSSLKDRKFEALQAGRALASARGEVAQKYPKVDPELYAHIQDPAAIDAYAARIQAGYDASNTLATGPTTPDAGSWGGAAPPSGQSTPPPAEKTPAERMRELAPTVLAKGKNAMAENLELRQLSAAPIIGKVLANASQRAGFDIETGEPLQ